MKDFSNANAAVHLKVFFSDVPYNRHRQTSWVIIQIYSTT